MLLLYKIKKATASPQKVHLTLENIGYLKYMKNMFLKK